MEILKIKKKGKKYQVEMTNEMVYLWHEDVMIKYQIFKPNMQISEEKMQLIIKDNEFYLAFDKALNYLNVMHSKRQVENYLRKTFDYDIVKMVINRLEELNYLNEKEFAKAYLYECFKNHKGPNLVKENLILEGINRDIVEEISALYTDEMEKEACNKAYLKQMNSYKKESYNSFKQKMTIFLTNKGFNSKMIAFSLANNQRLLDNIIDEEKLIEKAYDKYYRQYSRKFQGKELKERIKRGLYSKGFSSEKIKNIIESREEK